MSEELGRVKQWVAGLFAPTVLVLTTPKVDQICAKNNLDFVDLIRPFCRIAGMNVAVSLGESTSYIRDFRIYPSAEDVPAYLQGAGSTPWYDDFRNEYSRTIGPVDHEFFYHPVACISVVESSSNEPMHAVEIRPDRLPPLMRENFVDANIYHYYIMLHDPAETSQSAAETAFRVMRETFGAQSARLLVINTLPFAPPGTPAVTDIWRPMLQRRWDSFLGAAVAAATASHAAAADTAAHAAAAATGASAARLTPTTPAAAAMPVPTPTGASARPLTEVPASATADPFDPATVYGRCLSPQDMIGLQQVLRDFIMGVVIPFLDRKMQLLYAQIGGSRSFKAQWKAWLGRKTRTSGDTGYPFQSPESQVRQLADLAFMLQHYETAATNYRAVGADYKNDRAMKHFASTQEMLAVCLFMLDGSRREIDAAFDVAYTTLQQLSLRPLAVRPTILQAEIARARGLYRDAASVLLRASSNEPNDVLRAGLLLEQAALCFLCLNPPQWRKFAFHMVLTGHRYSQAVQQRHALRCYMVSATTYERHGFALIDDHINFTLGRLAAHLGDIERAVSHFTRLLGPSQQPVNRQQTFLREFLFLIKALVTEQPNREFPDVPLPLINTEDIAVFLRDNPTDNSAEWEFLRLQLVTDPLAMMALAPSSREQVSVVWEEVYVDVEVSNPMQVPIDVSDFRLDVEMTPPPALHRTLSAPALAPPRKVLSNKALPSHATQHRRAHSTVIVPLESDSDRGSLSEALAPTVPMGSQPALSAADAAATDASLATAPATTAAVDTLSGAAPAHSSAPAAAAGVSMAIMLEPASAASGSPSPAADAPVATAAGAAAAAAAGAAGAAGSVGGGDADGDADGATSADAATEGAETPEETAAAEGAPAPQLVDVETVEVKLAPGEKKKLRLLLRPRTEGTLHIRGVQYKLAGFAPVRRAFAFKGRRLNSTKQQRTSVVYEPDTRGTIRVTGPLPLLEVQMGEFPKRMLEGELRCVPLTLANKGHNVLARMRVRASHPEYFFIKPQPPGTDSDAEAAAASDRWLSVVADGRADLHAYNTHSPNEYMALPAPYVAPWTAMWLLPGESVTVSLWIRARRVGLQQFRFLFLYEAESAPKILPQRFLRRSATMEVRPSLAVVPFVRPSFTHPTEYILGLQVSNTNDAEALALRQVTAVSPVWRLEPLRAFDPATRSQADLSMAPGAANTLLFRLTGGPARTDTDAFTHSPLYGAAVASTAAPLAPFYSLERTYKPPPPMTSLMMTAREQAWAALQASQRQDATAAPAAPAVSVPSLDLLVLWESTSSRACGQLNLCGVVSAASLPPPPPATPTAAAPVPVSGRAPAAPAPSAPSAPPVAASAAGAGTPRTVGVVGPLKFALQSERLVSHNFSSGRMCTVDVTLVLSNPLSSALLYEIDVPLPQDDAAQPASSPARQYYWVGVQRSSPQRLAPQRTAQHTLRACVTAPGVYNLNRVRVAVRTVLGAETVLQYLSSPHWVTVVDASAAQA